MLLAIYCYTVWTYCCTVLIVHFHHHFHLSGRIYHRIIIVPFRAKIPFIPPFGVYLPCSPFKARTTQPNSPLWARMYSAASYIYMYLTPLGGYMSKEVPFSPFGVCLPFPPSRVYIPFSPFGAYIPFPSLGAYVHTATECR